MRLRRSERRSESLKSAKFICDPGHSQICFFRVFCVFRGSALSSSSGRRPRNKRKLKPRNTQNTRKNRPHLSMALVVAPLRRLPLPSNGPSPAEAIRGSLAMSASAAQAGQGRGKGSISVVPAGRIGFCRSHPELKLWTIFRSG
jgi:hypothetical protein